MNSYDGYILTCGSLAAISNEFLDSILAFIFRTCPKVTDIFFGSSFKWKFAILGYSGINYINLDYSEQAFKVCGGSGMPCAILVVL